MAAVMPWRRLWRDVNSDPRVTLLPRDARLLYVLLLPELDNDGVLPPVPGVPLETLIAEAVRLPVAVIRKQLSVLIERKLITRDGERLSMPRFPERQGLAGYDLGPFVPPSNSTEEEESKEERNRRLHRERQARYQERQRAASGEASERPSGAASGSDARAVSDDALPSQTLPSSEEKKREEESRKDATQNASVPARAPSATVRKPPSAPSMRDVLDTVAEWSNGRLSTILNSADTAALGAIVRQLHQDHRIDLHDWKNFGYWCRKGNPGFKTLERPLTWQWLIGTGDERDGRRIFEAIGEARQWEREQDAKEKETRRAS